ncbi:hypothetical protein SteCoe_28886 [Stentor coeruleus]|uniref:Uncharacterized protein n=1 Tax=Stentor coeruleus TaxID=5963 RepID=A0A1R2B785_9CILI|nr:hypothetical protein SteCoe_28886 [Stentor coeruleus]
MSRNSTPSPKKNPYLASKSDNYLTSFTYIPNRAYQLNLHTFRSSEKDPKRSTPKDAMPEFVREYVKGPISTSTIIHARSSFNHNRSVSYNYNQTCKPEIKQESAPYSGIPHLSYKDFKNNHAKVHLGDKYYIPQAIQLTKRSKIILHSSKPITINPNAYHSRKNSAYQKHSSIERKIETNETNGDLRSTLAPSMTYGEKILKLKAIVGKSVP